MAFTQRVGNDYINVRVEGGGRAILGNVYGQSSDERALAATSKAAVALSWETCTGSRQMNERWQQFSKASAILE
jgi:hypothetical protein